MSTGSTRSSAGLDTRRKRLLFRAWHRGIKEMDIVLGQYADANLADLSEDELDQLEHLMTAPDRDLFKWISGEAPVPANYKNDVFDQVVDFHKTA